MKRENPVKIRNAFAPAMRKYGDRGLRGIDMEDVSNTVTERTKVTLFLTQNTAVFAFARAVSSRYQTDMSIEQSNEKGKAPMMAGDRCKKLIVVRPRYRLFDLLEDLKRRGLITDIQKITALSAKP